MGPDVHFAVRVAERDGRDRAVEYLGERHAGALHQARAEAQPLGGVVVAADDDDAHPALRELHEKVVKKPHGLRRRRGAVIDVARDQHGVRRFGVDHGENSVENADLIVQHRKAAHALAEVEIAQMDQLHCSVPFCGMLVKVYHAQGCLSKDFAVEKTVDSIYNI